jgi:hypothetical protein
MVLATVAPGNGQIEYLEGPEVSSCAARQGAPGKLRRSQTRVASVARLESGRGEGNDGDCGAGWPAKVTKTEFLAKPLSDSSGGKRTV